MKTITRRRYRMNKQTSWFTADSHFNHENIIRLSSRPYPSVGEHDKELLELTNEYVGKNDFLFHLGDFCWEKTEKLQILLAKDILSKIVCKNVHLIVGNHDPRTSSGQATKEFSELFRSCSNYKVLRIPHPNGYNKKCILNHYAQRSWEGMHGGTYHLYGHSHANLPDNGSLSIDVGVDSVNKIMGEYRPISASEVCSYLSGREIKVEEETTKEDTE